MRKSLLLGLAAAPLVSVSVEARELQAEFDLVEMRLAEGDDEFVFDTTFELASNADAFVLKVEGGSEAGPDVDEVGAQLLYARMVGADTRVMAGLRHDFRPSGDINFAVVAVEQALGGMVEAESFFQLSEYGDVTGTAQLIAGFPLGPALVIEPRVELEWAAQSVPEERLGAGIGGINLAARLRQSIGPNFNVYVGAVHSWLIGDTRGIARAVGESVSATRAVVGVGWGF